MRVIDLFCGCGGLSLGFLKDNHTIVKAVEFDKNIAASYNHNHPDIDLIVDDIRNVDNENVFKTNMADIIIFTKSEQIVVGLEIRIKQTARIHADLVFVRIYRLRPRICGKGRYDLKERIRGKQVVMVRKQDQAPARHPDRFVGVFRDTQVSGQFFVPYPFFKWEPASDMLSQIAVLSRVRQAELPAAPGLGPAGSDHLL